MNIEKAAVVSTYSGSAVTIVAGMTINEWVALIGLLIAAAGFATSLWFKHKHLMLDAKRTRHLTAQNDDADKN